MRIALYGKQVEYCPEAGGSSCTVGADLQQTFQK
jgi:hypothetical protein